MSVVTAACELVTRRLKHRGLREAGGAPSLWYSERGQLRFERGHGQAMQIRETLT